MAKKSKSVEKRNKQKRLIPAWIWMVMGSIITLGICALMYLWQPFKSFEKTPEPIDGYQVADNGAEDNQTENSTETNTLAENSSEENGDTSSTENSKTNEKLDSKKAKDFEFYDILPEQEITPIPDEVIVLEPNEEKQPAIKPDITLEASDNDPEGASKSNNSSDNNNSNNSNTDSNETYDGGEVLSEPESNNNESAPQASNENTTNESDPIEQIITKSSSNYILQINSFGSAEEADNRRAEVLLAGVDARVVKTPMGAEGDYLYQVISNEFSSKETVFEAQERLKSAGIDSLIVERKAKS